MGKSWDHAVQVLTAESRERYSYRHCASGKCAEPVTHLVTFKVITGRAGRVGSQSRLICDGHAEKFADKHEIDITKAA
jgi:hypothetical protein